MALFNPGASVMKMNWTGIMWYPYHRRTQPCISSCQVLMLQSMAIMFTRNGWIQCRTGQILLTLRVSWLNYSFTHKLLSLQGSMANMKTSHRHFSILQLWSLCFQELISLLMLTGQLAPHAPLPC
jgi:hypothetical protein